MTGEKIVCIGCGSTLGVYSGGGLALTCICGATCFMIGDKPALPSSLYLGRSRSAMPHVEYYLGRSDCTSPARTEMEQALRKAGSISETECEECKAGLHEKLERLKLAYQEDESLFWMPDEHVASHFEVPLRDMRELKKQMFTVVLPDDPRRPKV